MPHAQPDHATTETPTPAAAGHTDHGHEASIWPAVIALGLTIAFLGLLTTSWSIGGVGVVGTVVGIGGWVGELHVGEPHQDTPDLAEPPAGAGARQHGR